VQKVEDALAKKPVEVVSMARGAGDT
jgi:hypothetical protein